MMFAKRTDIEAIAKEAFQKVIEEYKQGVSEQINVSLTAFKINIESKINEQINDKLEIIKGIAESFKELSNRISNENETIRKQIKTCGNSSQLEEKLEKQFSVLSDAINDRLNKVEKRIDENFSKIEKVGEKIAETKSDISQNEERLDAFIDVISEKIADLTKKKKPIAKVFKEQKCPFDQKIEKCEIWEHRIDANDAPVFCIACRSTVTLNDKGLTNVRIQEIATGNSRSTDEIGK